MPHVAALRPQSNKAAGTHRVPSASRLILGWVLLSAFSAGPAYSQPPAPPPAPPTFAETLTAKAMKALSFKKLRKDPLLKPPFIEAPLDSPKGLAAKIKAEELDAKNRIKAVEYLGTVDCVLYPEAQEMLIKVMQADPIEEVRYAAVKALQVMLARGIERETRGKESRRADNCRGCCGPAVLNALSERAYVTDDAGCPLEPSLRVREAAVEAITICQIQCYYCQPAIPAAPADPTPGAPLEEQPPVPPAPGEELPTGPDASNSTTPGVQAQPVAHSADEQNNVVGSPREPSTRGASGLQPVQGNPIIQGLRGYCPVALKSRQFVKAQPEFVSVYNERTFHFASAAAKQEFDAQPQRYAPVYAGIDPVLYVSTGEAREGAYLREHDDRLYLFASKDNWMLFQQSPQKYTQK